MWLVTGATGFVGNNVVRLLLNRGASVRALVRGNTVPRALADLPVQIAYGDVGDAHSLHAALRDVKWVVHAAGVTDIGWGNAELHRRVNVEGTRNVAIASRNAAARLVYVSSVDALGVNSNGQPVDETTVTDVLIPCPYVLTKRAAEAIVSEEIKRGLQATIVNPGFMLGPWDWKISSGKLLFEVANGRALLVPPGSNSCCDVRDVAVAIVTVAERDNPARRYILGGDSVSYRATCDIVARVTGGRHPIRTARPSVLRLIGFLGDAYGRLRRHEGTVNSAIIAISMLQKNYSSAKAQQELGYRTRRFEESAIDAWAWFVQHGYVKK